MAIRYLLFVVLGFALCTQLAFAQVNTATISGTVHDTSGAVLPGASVTIVNQETGISRMVVTNETGRYSAPALGLGNNYQVTAELAGFQSQVRSGIALTVGREAVVDFTLSVGAVSEKVEVTEDAPLVELTNANLGGLVDDRTIREMPLNSRSWDALAYTVPGVVKYTTAGGGFNSGSGANKFSVSGSRSYSNSFRVEGTDVNDSSNSTPGGAAGTNLGVDAIREFKIVATTFSAEYGRATGAVVSAVTRSGTNELHGTLFEFLRNNAFDARTIFDLEDHDGDGKADLGPFRRNQFGGVLGGPIRKDKTFFFGAYEGFRQVRNETTIAVVPTAAAKQGILPCAPPSGRVAGSEAARLCPVTPNSNGSYGTYRVTPSSRMAPFLQYYPDPNGQIFKNRLTGEDLYIGEFVGSPKNVVTQDFFMGRIDHQLTASTSIFGRYQFDNDKSTSPFVLGNIEERNHARRQYATFQGSTVFTPALLNAFRFAFNRSAQFSDAFATTDLAKTLTFVPGKIIGTLTVGEERGTPTVSEVGTDTNYPRFWVYNLFEAGDDLTFSKGSHGFKWGGVVRRIQNNNTVQSESRGQYTFQNIEDLILAKPQLFGGVPIGEEGYKGIRQTMLGFYMQDDYKMSPRLTLNMGLRWETTTDPRESNHQISNLLDIREPKETVYPDIKAFFKTLDKNFQPR